MRHQCERFQTTGSDFRLVQFIQESGRSAAPGPGGAKPTPSGSPQCVSACRGHTARSQRRVRTDTGVQDDSGSSARGRAHPPRRGATGSLQQRPDETLSGRLCCWRTGWGAALSPGHTAKVGATVPAAEPRGWWRAEIAAGDGRQPPWPLCELQSGGSKDPQGGQKQSPHRRLSPALPHQAGSGDSGVPSPGAAAPLSPGPAISPHWGLAPTPPPWHLLSTVGAPDPGQLASVPGATAVRPGGLAQEGRTCCMCPGHVSGGASEDCSPLLRATPSDGKGESNRHRQPRAHCPLKTHSLSAIRMSAVSPGQSISHSDTYFPSV